MSTLDDRVVRFLAGLDLRAHPVAVREARGVFVKAATCAGRALERGGEVLFAVESALDLLTAINFQDHTIAEQREAAELAHLLRARTVTFELGHTPKKRGELH